MRLQLKQHFCTFAGQWSGSTPHCQPVRCTALEILDAHLRVLSLNNSFRGQASFLCPFGYALVGLETIECGSDGRWSGHVPKCKAISCPSPLPPLNGKVMDNGHYLVGNTVQYNCDEGFVLIGEPIIRCTESGLWSHAPPFCKYIATIHYLVELEVVVGSIFKIVPEWVEFKCLGYFGNSDFLSRPKNHEQI